MAARPTADINSDQHVEEQTAELRVRLQRLAVSVEQAAEATGISRSSLYEEMQAGRLKFAKVGARRVILVDDLRSWLLSARIA